MSRYELIIGSSILDFNSKVTNAINSGGSLYEGAFKDNIGCYYQAVIYGDSIPKVKESEVTNKELFIRGEVPYRKISLVKPPIIPTRPVSLTLWG